MNEFGLFSSDRTVSKSLRESMYPDLPRTEEEIGNLWIGCMYRTVMRK